MATGSVGRARFPADAAIKIKGDTDDTLIGNEGDALKVTTLEDATENTGCPILTNKFRVEADTSATTLTTSYQTLFTYTGSGKFTGFELQFDKSSATIKLTVDSQVIFELITDDVENISSSKSLTPGVPVEFDGSKTVFSFLPACPIAYGTDVKIEAKKVTGATTDATGLLIALTKET